MGKRNRQQRRRWRRHLRTLFFTVLLLGAMPGLVATGVTGQLTMLWLIPVGMIGAVVGAPFALLAMAVALAGMALPLAVVLGPLYLAYRVVDGRRQAQELAMASIPPEVLLRRRYVAGELSYAEFQDEMLTHLKESYARGAIALAAYEAELDRLMRPGRQLDAAGDPSLAGALRAR
jgi:energy-converting hydrogenase Eha subunit C